MRQIGRSLSIVAGVAGAAVALASCNTPSSGALPPPPPPAPAPLSDRCTPRQTDIYFELWSDRLGHEAQAQLGAFTQSYQGCRIDHVRITGMADAAGGRGANAALAQKRADVIAGDLAAAGWDRSKFEIVSLGQAGATVGHAVVPLRRLARIEVAAAAP